MNRTRNGPSSLGVARYGGASHGKAGESSYVWSGNGVSRQGKGREQSRSFLFLMDFEIHPSNLLQSAKSS